MISKLNFRKEKVISFLEWKIIQDEASDTEMKMYEDYKFYEHISKIKYKNTYIKLLKEMKEEYEGRK